MSVRSHRRGNVQHQSKKPPMFSEPEVSYAHADAKAVVKGSGLAHYCLSADITLTTKQGSHAFVVVAIAEQYAQAQSGRRHKRCRCPVEGRQYTSSIQPQRSMQHDSGTYEASNNMARKPLHARPPQGWHGIIKKSRGSDIHKAVHLLEKHLGSLARARAARSARQLCRVLTAAALAEVAQAPALQVQELVAALRGH